MPVTIALSEGFDGEDVEVRAGGRMHRVEAARTSMLTGFAGEVVVETDEGSLPVAVRVADGPGSPGDVPWTGYDVPQGGTLVLDLEGGRLSGRVMPGPVGFA